MDFNGHLKSSFIDYPNRISTVVFTGGCNFRCPYCHNSHLVNENEDGISEEEILNFIEKRKKFIDAVCICGGEPTMHTGLYGFIKRVKEKGFLVKLDTNGTNPDLLSKLISENLVDYVAMDMKAPLHKYKDVVKSEVDIDNIKSSIEIIKNSLVEYEFRTTVCKELLTGEDIVGISKEITGTKKYVIQNFKDSDNVLAGKGKYTDFSQEDLNFLKQNLESNFEDFVVRM